MLLASDLINWKMARQKRPTDRHVEQSAFVRFRATVRVYPNGRFSLDETNAGKPRIGRDLIFVREWPLQVWTSPRRSSNRKIGYFRIFTAAIFLMFVCLWPLRVWIRNVNFRNILPQKGPWKWPRRGIPVTYSSESTGNLFPGIIDWIDWTHPGSDH